MEHLNYLASELQRPGENPPIGIVLCTDKDATEVHCATAGIEKSVLVSRYMVELPTEEKLARWLREERASLEKIAEREAAEKPQVGTASGHSRSKPAANLTAQARAGARRQGREGSATTTNTTSHTQPRRQTPLESLSAPHSR